MRKELRDRVEKTFAALGEEVAKNPKAIGEISALLRDLNKSFRENRNLAYADGVTARKAEREEKRAAKTNAMAEAKAAKTEAQAKLQAALAIRVNGKIAKKRAKKEETVEVTATVAEAPAEAALPEIF